MLVLTRKMQETIKIGDEVTIHILRVKGNTVRLGIDAPREIRVMRGELADKDSAVREPSAATTPLTAHDRREAEADDATIDGGLSQPRPALADFFSASTKANSLSTNDL